MKPLLKAALIVGGVGCASLLAMTACFVTEHGVRFGIFGGDASSKAERTDTREFQIAAGKRLSATTPYGTIRVRATEGGAGSLHATVHAWGATQAEADDQLARTSVVVDETAWGASIRLEVRKPAAESDARQGGSSVDLEIAIPAGVALELKSNSGDVSADGAGFAAARVESSYGSVRVENVTGETLAASNSGKVTVSNVRDGAVDAHSGYGDVVVKDVRGGAVTIETHSGSLEIERVHGTRFSATSGYGSVVLSEVESEGELVATSKSGEVRVTKAKAISLRLKSGYGKVSARESRGDLVLESSSGDISAEDAGPRVEARTGYGSVEVDGVLSAVTAASNSGDVAVTARATSKVDADWKLTSKYGRVRLAAPREAAFDLAAKTGYGEIELGYSVQLEPGVVKKNGKQVRGKVGGGGRLVTIESQSGDIGVNPLDDPSPR